MAQIQKKTHDTKPKSTCFLGCFQFSDEVFEKNSPEKVRSSSRKKTRWFSWSRFCMEKNATKTVPVDATVSEKTNQNIEIQASKSKSGKLTSRRQFPDAGRNPTGQIPAVVSDQIIIEKPQKTRYGPEQSTILENRKHLDHVDSTKDDTCKKRLSFSRKIESIRTGPSHPGSPETKPKSGTTAALMSQSASFLARNREKRAANTSAHSPIMLKKPNPKNGVDVGNFDPMVGMSIIMVTLIIMLLWGRLCAILCTSAWFYFIPRLRMSVKSDNIVRNSLNLGDPEMNSEEHKKKVVLEGFLERNHRSSFGIL